MSLALAAACTLQVVTTEVAPAETGWTEASRFEVVADGAECPWIDVLLPPDVGLASIRGRARLGDGTRRRLGPERFERRDRDLQGHGAVRVHLPDLVSGDRVVLDVRRDWDREAAWRWSPAPARYGELVVAGDVDVALSGDVRRDRRIWVADAGPDDAAVLTAPGLSGDWDNPLEAVEPVGRVDVSRRLELRVPPGDPQRSLYPGGGSSVLNQVWGKIPAEERLRGWRVPLPLERSELRWSITPAAAGHVVERDTDLVVILEPSEGSASVALSWVQPDAPTFGERAPGEALDVDAPGGLVVWERDAWLLAMAQDRPVLPARQALIKALDHRFRAAALPEPSVPNRLRGRTPSWELAAELRGALYERVAPATWPTDPLWPRKLQRARRSGVLTPLEGALTVWLYARQLGLEAQWALVRPAHQGPGAPTSPSGYTEALVRLTLDGEARWMDPACRVCAPFELRPELEGASAIGQGLTQTPPPTPGRWAVEMGEDEVRWVLEGPAALELRRWLITFPAPQRPRALAERMAGPGAELTGVSGVTEPGQPITAVARRGQGLGADPLALPPTREDGTTWIPWVGTREIRWPGREGAPASLEEGPLSWSRTLDEDALVERLTVDARQIPGPAADALAAARQPDPAEPDELPEEPPAEEPVDDAPIR